MGIKRIVKHVVDKGADRVAKLSALSPEQLNVVEVKREEYLSERPDMTGEESTVFTQKMLAVGGVEIYNAYLSQLKDLYLPLDSQAEYEVDFQSNYNIRYINITKWVTDKKENSLEKLVNVYEVLSNEECNISLVFHRKLEETAVYLAVTNLDNDDSNTDIDTYRKRLEAAIRGNFPGSTLSDDIGRGQMPCFNDRHNYSVATASNIPTEKSEKFISQTIEKLLDGVVPETREQEYILILLATPIQDIAERKLHLSEIYSTLAPYANWQTNYTYTESDSRGSSATVGVNVGASAGTQTGQNFSRTSTEGATDTEGSTESESTSVTEGESQSKTKTTTKEKSSSTSGTLGGSVSNGFVGVNASVSHTRGKSLSKSIAKSFSKSFSKTKGKSIAQSTSQAISKSAALSRGASKALSLGANFGANFARTSTVTATIGKNEGIT